MDKTDGHIIGGDNDIPCKIKNVHLEGVNRTNGRLLVRIISPIFAARNLKDLGDRLTQVNDRLNKLDAFKNIEFNITPNDSDGMESQLNPLDVNIHVKEYRRLTGGIEANSQNASLSVSSRLPNTTGRGDSLKAELNQQRYARGGEIRYTWPFAPWLDTCSPRFSSSIYQSNNESPASAYQQRDRGISQLFEFNSTRFCNLRHTISFDNVWRHIYSLTSAPIKTRLQSGPSYKSSLRYQVEYDNRDSPTFPSSGVLVRLAHESAGVTRVGNVNFKKNEIYLQGNYSIVPKLPITCQGCLNAGILIPSGNNSLICDKFFVGGPLTLRGYDWNGIGPENHGFALGARAFWLGGAHIYTPLPYVSPKSFINNHVKFHVFANAGNLDDFTFTDNLGKNLELLKKGMRYSYGIGLVFHFNLIRLELNYCLPYGRQKGDRVNEGPQCGFGLMFV